MSAPIGPYRPIVRAGDWLVLSGQLGLSEGAVVAGGMQAELRQALLNLASLLDTEGATLSDGAVVSGGLQAELRQALTNLAALLDGEGATLTDVVKTTVFLRHIRDYPAMNETYVEVFGDHRPARAAVGVDGLPLGALVEVEAWAYVGG